MLGNVKVFLLSICGAVVRTILLVSANTMAMSVRERIKEIGVLRTLGFTTEKGAGHDHRGGRDHCDAGRTARMSDGIRHGHCMGGVFQVMFGSLRMPPVVLLISLGIAFAIGLLSSVVPAYNASRVPITDALRHVE